MNEVDFTDLVDRATGEIEPSPPPVAELLRAGRRAQRRYRLVLAVVSVSAAAAVLSTGIALLSQRDPAGLPIAATPAVPSSTMTPLEPSPVAPAGTRLVGVNGVMVAVPQAWSTDEVGCDGQTPVKPTVVFSHGQTAFRSCGVFLKKQVPSLRIDIDENFEAKAGLPRAEQIEAKHGPWSTDHLGFSVRSAAVAKAGVTFTVVAATRSEVDRILDTVQLVPEAEVLVPNWYHDTDHLPWLGQLPALIRDAGLAPTVIETPVDWEAPGALIRTEPAIGTPVAPGSKVTVVNSAGNLDYYATKKSLAAQGWQVSKATTFEPDITRAKAIELAGFEPVSGNGFSTDAFLRNVNIACPKACDGKAKPAWLVVLTTDHSLPGPPKSRILALDATTGARLATATHTGSP